MKIRATPWKELNRIRCTANQRSKVRPRFPLPVSNRIENRSPTASHRGSSGASSDCAAQSMRTGSPLVLAVFVCLQIHPPLLCAVPQINMLDDISFCVACPTPSRRVRPPPPAARAGPLSRRKIPEAIPSSCSCQDPPYVGWPSKLFASLGTGSTQPRPQGVLSSSSSVLVCDMISCLSLAATRIVNSEVQDA